MRPLTRPRVLWAWVAALGVVAAAGWNDVHVALAHWVAHAIVVLGLVGCASVVERLGRAAPTGWRTHVGGVLHAGALAIAANACTAPLAYAAIRTDVPLRDGVLARFDAALGLGLPGVRSVLLHVPEPLWWRVYGLLVPLLVATVVLLALFQPPRARRFLFAYLASFTLALPLIALVQAEGPWRVHGFALSETQADYVRELAALKAPGPFRFDPTRTTGVVTFPSFHALLALLAGWGLAPMRGVGPVAVLTAAGIVLATMATGWHYAADVLGGAAVCAAAIGISGWAARWEHPER